MGRLRSWRVAVGAQRDGRGSRPRSRRVHGSAPAPRRRAATSCRHRSGRSRAACAPSRTPAARSHRPGRRKPLEPVIAVDLEHAPESGQMSGRTRALAVLGIHVGGGRVRRAAPGPVIDRVAPQPSRLGPAAPRIEHRQGRVVGEQLVGRQHRAEHQVVQRRQPPAGPAHPIAERRAVQGHALPRQHLRLPIQRQGVAELADHHMRQQRLGGHAAIDGSLRRRGDDDGALAGRQA